MPVNIILQIMTPFWLWEGQWEFWRIIIKFYIGRGRPARKCPACPPKSRLAGRRRVDIFREQPESEACRGAYIMVYTSNQTLGNTDVFYDDMSILHIGGPIVRVDDYGISHAYRHYPFGLTYNTSQYTGALTNKFLFNGNEFIDSLGFNSYDFHARIYEPALGRFIVSSP